MQCVVCLEPKTLRFTYVCDVVSMKTSTTYKSIFDSEATHEPRVTAIKRDQKLDLLTFMPKKYDKRQV